MTNIVNGHDLDTQSGRADYRKEGGQVEGNSGGGYDYSGPGGSGRGGGTQTATQGATFNTGGPSNPTGPGTVKNDGSMDAAVKQLGGQINSLMGAIQSGNAAAMAEAVRQFDLTFGLDKEKFGESQLVDKWNHEAQLAKQALDEAGVTGLFNGNPTLAKQAQDFDMQFKGNQQALDAMKLVADMHADPFRQIEMQYGIANEPGLARVLKGMSQGTALPQFTTNPDPQAAAASADSRTLAYMRNSILNQQQQQQGQGQGQGQGGMPQGMRFASAGPQYTPQQQSFLDRFKSPTDVVARVYGPADKATQDMITSAISRNTGMDQDTVHKQIMAQLPSFRAPTFGMANL